MPGITEIILYRIQLDHQRLDTPNDKEREKKVLTNYTRSNLTLKNGKVLTTVVGNMRLS